MFVNIEDSSLVRVVDTRKLEVLARWPLSPGEEPSGLAMDVKNGRLFSGCHNQMLVVMDSRTGAVLADLPIGKGVDGVMFDPVTGLAYSSNGEGTLTVVGPKKGGGYEVVETVTTEPGARTMALDEATHRVVLVTAQFGPAPPPTPEHPRPRRPILPGTFQVMAYGQ